MPAIDTSNNFPLSGVAYTLLMYFLSALQARFETLQAKPCTVQLERKDSLPRLACTQQACGEKESFAWTGNLLKCPINHISFRKHDENMSQIFF